MSMLEGKVAVTGGCGFIGSHIAEHLANQGLSVTVIDNLSSGKPGNISGFRDRVRLIEADIADPEEAQRALKDVSLVFHCAANAQMARSVEDPAFDFRSNVMGTVSVLEACRKNSVRRFVFSSSCAVYGEQKKLPIKEAAEPDPKSPYALGKLCAENYCRLFSGIYGLETAILRYFNVYGPRQDECSPYSGVISVFLKNARSGSPLTIFGDGGQTRDFIHVSDVVRANLLAAEAKSPRGEVFNIGTGQAISISRLAEIVQAAAGKYVEIKHERPREGDIRHSVADISKAKSMLGFRPSYSSISDGISGLL